MNDSGHPGPPRPPSHHVPSGAADVIAFEGVFAALRDPGVFEQVRLDPDWGTICWPGDLDIAPEPLYERVTGKNPVPTHGTGREAAPG